MFSFNKVFASVFLAVLCASTATAVPFPVSSKYATHRTREISRDFKLEAYHPRRLMRYAPVLVPSHKQALTPFPF